MFLEWPKNMGDEYCQNCRPRSINQHSDGPLERKPRGMHLKGEIECFE